MKGFSAIILAGGFGTRLRDILKDLPKPMAPVREKPFLHFLLSQLAASGCNKVIISTGHLAEKISDCFGDNFQNMKLEYSHETEPLGTGGAVKKAFENCSDEEILVMNGDSYFDIDIPAFFEMHSSHNSDCSIALRNVQNTSRYGTITLGADHKIVGFSEKNPDHSNGLINGGIYIIRRTSFLPAAPDRAKFSIEKDFFENNVTKIQLRGFVFNGYFIDIGIPEDYQRAQHEFERFEN